MKITLISDTHGKHNQISPDLGQGNLLIHAGDFCSYGYYEQEIRDFLGWYDNLNDFDFKIFIAGNHDRLFELEPKKTEQLVNSYKNVDYIQDDLTMIQIGDEPEVKIWGSPWQPEFNNWAFNLPRNGDELYEKWKLIPEDVDILITHGPPFGTLDYTTFGNLNVGCEILAHRLTQIKPKLHIFGHIHDSAGYKFDGKTHYFNVSVLNEQYHYKNKPISIDWDPKTNLINFINH